MKFTPNLVIGLVITLIGVILMLDRLGMLEISQALRLWPVMVTLFGVSIIVQAMRAETSTGNPAGGRPIVGPGFVLFLVVVSVLAWRTEGRSFVRRGDPADAQMSLVGIMGRDDRVSLSNAFSGAEMTTVMGRTRLDLRKATLKTDGEVVVDIFGMMGAVEVIVPETWTVDAQAWAVMGGVEDRRKQPARPKSGDDIGDSRGESAVTPLDGAASKTIGSTGVTRNPPASATLGATTTPSVPATQPRLVIRGMVLMGALVIRS